MPVLSWDKPEKVMSTEEWVSISADSAPPGVYTPNMSEEDKLKWKAKLVGKKSDNPIVEIRKTFIKSDNKAGRECTYTYCQCLIKVSLESVDGMIDCNVLMSMNGRCGMSYKEVEEFKTAIEEAKAVLRSLNR